MIATVKVLEKVDSIHYRVEYLSLEVIRVEEVTHSSDSPAFKNLSFKDKCILRAEPGVSVTFPIVSEGLKVGKVYVINCYIKLSQNNVNNDIELTLYNIVSPI